MEKKIQNTLNYCVETSGMAKSMDVVARFMLDLCALAAMSWQARHTLFLVRKIETDMS